MRSVWRPVGVFTPNGLLSGRGRHENCVERTFCGHLSRKSLICIVLFQVIRIFIPINRGFVMQDSRIHGLYLYETLFDDWAGFVNRSHGIGTDYGR